MQLFRVRGILFDNAIVNSAGIFFSIMELFTVRGILFDKAIVNSEGILFRIMQLLTVRGIFVYEVTVVYTVHIVYSRMGAVCTPNCNVRVAGT